MIQEEPGTWRKLLEQIISDPEESQRLVRELNVRSVTLRRWVKGESVPRQQNIRHLLSALPDYRERFLALFAEDEAFEDLVSTPFNDMRQEIPSTFYTQIFQMRGNISPTQRYWSIATTIVNQALYQFDPDNVGIAIYVVRCMKSSGHPHIIRSLRESVGQGTSPWTGNLEQKSMFLGAESLAGYVVSTCRPADLPDIREDTMVVLPRHFVEKERSAAAHPILLAGRVAGCLLVSSTEPYYFHSAMRLNLVSDYAHLMALAFEPEDFVDPSSIELAIMPPHEEQKKFFATFRQRLTTARHLLHEQKLDIDAEQYVWEELEEEFLNEQAGIECQVPWRHIS